ncbi:MAG: response regulator [Thermodesulfobacteriota bacterium]
MTRPTPESPSCPPCLDRGVLLPAGVALLGFLPVFFLDPSIGLRLGVVWSLTLFCLTLAARHTFRTRIEQVRTEYATRLQEANQELTRFMEGLDQLVAERTETLHNLNTELRLELEERRQAEQRAAHANQAKSQFLANMSHEIRTPLNAILGMTNLAAKLELTPKMRQYIDIIRDSGESLLSLINDILDFSKIEAGRLDMEEANFDLQEVLDSVADMFSRKSAEKGVELIVTMAAATPNALIGDPLRLKQILVNLVNNAIKFTDKGEIIVSARPLATADGKTTLEFVVQDSGSGINHDQIRKLFSEYTQADSSTARLFGGTGLGLAISKRLVELMDGTITATSEQDRGSAFRFTVCLATQHNDMQRRDTLPPVLWGKRLLVAEPNAALRDTLTGMLRGVGYEAMACPTVAELRTAMATDPRPDGLLLNWQLPDGNPMEIQREIRGSDLPLAVVMMAPMGFEACSAAAEAERHHTCLIKPIKQRYLHQALLDVFAPTAGPTAVAIDPDPACAADREYFRGAQVLVVEDDVVNQTVTRKLLANRGLSVVVVGNGSEAVEALRLKAYHAVLMDVQMPEMDGFTATRNIRAMANLKQLPIIAMTAHAMKGDKEKCIEAGMNDYIHKPLDFDLLFTTLRKWISPPDQRLP